MSDVSGVTLNSAFSAGQFGLQRASDGMTQAASNIAQQTAGRQQELGGTLQSGSLANSSQKAPANITSDLISLNVNSLNAQASAKVLDVANDTLGTIIDTLA
ncbi:MAG: hypothetical protein ABNH03_03440 [Alteromonas sp.]|jgi:hypothetical protein|uniref:hypothetical protein n=1 Tax=Alteromonas sp. TaxID=232 RepID=UPI0032D91C82